MSNKPTTDSGPDSAKSAASSTAPKTPSKVSVTPAVRKYGAFVVLRIPKDESFRVLEDARIPDWFGVPRLESGKLYPLDTNKWESLPEPARFGEAATDDSALAFELDKALWLNGILTDADFKTADVQGAVAKAAAYLTRLLEDEQQS